jgi:hypothetical protein
LQSVLCVANTHDRSIDGTHEGAATAARAAKSSQRAARSRQEQAEATRKQSMICLVDRTLGL